MALWHRGLLSLALILSVASSAAALDQDVAKLQGQPVQPAIDKLGPPDSQQKTDAGTTYTWTIQT
ncbi:MAG: hypothetical protein ACHQK9_16860, partial [Reyranellales bacterium]